GWCALEYVAADRGRAVAAVFRLTHAEGEAYRLVFRGVDPGRTYRVRTEPGSGSGMSDGEAFAAAGAALMNEGLNVRLETPLSSRLLLLEADGR
ncbi:MAG: GH36 C-terminal domain-containing protein, partial [Planctomycetota bacterium]